MLMSWDALTRVLSGLQDPQAPDLHRLVVAVAVAAAAPPPLVAVQVQGQAAAHHLHTHPAATPSIGCVILLFLFSQKHK